MRWAASQLPELKNLTVDSALTVTRAAWYSDAQPVRLFVRRDWRDRRSETRCVPLDFLARDGALYASLANVDARALYARQTLRLADSVQLYDDTSRDDYARGDARAERLQLQRVLSAVDDDGLTYGGIAVRPEPRCSWTTVRCGSSECRSCQLYVATQREPEGIDTRVSPSDGTCQPCLPDPQAPLLPRLARILARHHYFRVGPGLRFYRQRADCEAASRAEQSKPVR